MRYIAVVSLIFASLLCLPAYAKSQDVTVGGLTSGMKISEIVSKLGPNFTSSDTAAITRGQAVNFAKGYEDFNVLAMGSKTVYIEHQQFFPPGGLLSADELQKALVDKYGPASFHDDDTQSEVWIVINGQTMTGNAITPQLRGCTGYETQGPFFRQTQAPENANFALSFPKVPVKPQLAGCGTVIQARPSLVPENKGLVSHLLVTLFDVKAAQDWYDAAQIDFQKIQKDAVDAMRKNKPNL